MTPIREEVWWEKHIKGKRITEDAMREIVREAQKRIMTEVRQMVLMAPGYQGIISTQRGPFLMRQEMLDKLDAIFPIYAS